MIVKNNVLTEGLSGKFQQVVFRQRAGKTVVAKWPAITNLPATAAQQTIRVSFSDAVAFAKSILTDPALKLAYKAKAKPGQSAFNAAIADFLNHPGIDKNKLLQMQQMKKSKY